MKQRKVEVRTIVRAKKRTIAPRIAARVDEGPREILPFGNAVAELAELTAMARATMMYLDSYLGAGMTDQGEVESLLDLIIEKATTAREEALDTLHEMAAKGRAA